MTKICEKCFSFEGDLRSHLYGYTTYSQKYAIIVLKNLSI